MGDLVITTASRRGRARRSADRPDGAPGEYALLEFLASQPAGSAPRESDIWEHVYDFRSEAGSNVVDVYVGYLRRKLHGPGQAPLIRRYYRRRVRACWQRQK